MTRRTYFPGLAVGAIVLGVGPAATLAAVIHETSVETSLALGSSAVPTGAAAVASNNSAVLGSSSLRTDTANGNPDPRVGLNMSILNNDINGFALGQTFTDNQATPTQISAVRWGVIVTEGVPASQTIYIYTVGANGTLTAYGNADGYSENAIGLVSRQDVQFNFDKSTAPYLMPGTTYAFSLVWDQTNTDSELVGAFSGGKASQQLIVVNNTGVANTVPENSYLTYTGRTNRNVDYPDGISGQQTSYGFVNGTGTLRPDGTMTAQGGLNSPTIFSGANVGSGVDQLLFDVYSVVPEPSALAFLSIGALGLLGRRRQTN